MRQPEPFQQILERIDRATWSDLLFWAGGPLAADTPMVILSEASEEIADDRVGPYVLVSGAVWRPFLGVDDVRSVRANLAAQREQFDTEHLLAALQYYYEHDAFMRLGPAGIDE